MAKDKKMVEAITSMDVDFAKWYKHLEEGFLNMIGLPMHG